MTSKSIINYSDTKSQKTKAAYNLFNEHCKISHSKTAIKAIKGSDT